MSFTIGSLFDGSGGFPLAATMCGGIPLWASEVEPYPIAVTRSRLPAMKHWGNICKINGADIDPVYAVTFGSPCQGLSNAGLQKGLADDRSILFFEAVRVIKEMREATNGVYPRFAVWENVPGAFSSNGGEDFRIVLETLIKIVEPAAVMPPVPKNGWPYADSYSGDGWSLAYRVFDAQYWGVPQRRRRIYLVIDFTGQCARKILFEREGLQGYFEAVGSPKQGIEANVKNCIRADDRAGENGCVAFHLLQDPVPNSNVFPCMGQGNSVGGQASIGVAYKIAIGCSAGFKAGQGVKARGMGWEIEKSPTLAAESGGNSVPSVCIKSFDARGNGDGDTVNTITGDHESRITDYTSVVLQPICCIDGDKIGKAERSGGSGLGIRDGDKMYTLTEKDAGTHSVAYGIGNGQANQSVMEERTGTLNCMHDQQAVCYADADRLCYIVRRLIPAECARLQGFADRYGVPDLKNDFTDGEYRFWLDVRNTHAAINGKAVKDYNKSQMLKWYNNLHTDSSEYKMWGNGIALPCALYVMQGIADVFDQQERRS